MTRSEHPWTATAEDAHGNTFPMGVRAQDGYVVFASSKFWFKVAPDSADVIAPSVEAAANLARQQQRRQ